MTYQAKYRDLTKPDYQTGGKPVFEHKDENQFTKDPNACIQRLKQFTDTYKQYSSEDISKRELACLRVQYPLYFCDVQDTDLFAGRDQYPAIGFGPQAGEYVGYYCDKGKMKNLFNHPDIHDESISLANDLMAFWEKEDDSFKIRTAYPQKMSEILDNDNWMGSSIIGAPLYRMGGTHNDYDRLLKLGIKGLKKEIQSKTVVYSEAKDLYNSMLGALDLLTEVIEYYANTCKKQQSMASKERRKELKVMESTLRNIASNKANSFREALQLVFLYGDISGSFNYGRMDEYLGDYFVYDLESGIIDEKESIRLLSNFWYILDAKGNIWDGRVIVGGKARRNEQNADKLALVIMASVHKVKGIVPQLSLRFYKDQNPELYRKALDMISEGNPYPMLYNDDVNIPSVSTAFKITEDEAEHYLPFGCGEYVLNHRSVGTPSGVINLLNALSVTLRRGKKSVDGNTMGLKTEEMDQFDTFDGLLSSYKKQVELYVEQLAHQEKLEYDKVSESANFLFLSILFDDCIERGKSIFNGGVRYLGGTLETYGNTNTADSLTAIKKLVYDEKKLSLDDMIKILDADFNGFEKERRMMLDAPKYGNDDNTADQMKVEIDGHVSQTARNMAEKAGLHSYLIVNINNNANATMGKQTPATPDGRKAFTYMANANAATSGMDQNGLTAYLNSIVKPRTNIHAGAVQNLKLSKELMTQYRNQTEMLLKTYFQKGGAQCMINCLGRDDLKDAMVHPENHSNLIVRVGGFSARFVELDKETQLEILNRTMY